LEHIVATVWIEVSVETFLQQCEQGLLLAPIVATLTLNHIIATMTLDIVVAFVITFIVLLSMPVMWYEEHLWNFSVLQRENLSNLASYISLMWIYKGFTELKIHSAVYGL
jgi:hypothetical protein